MTHEVVECAVVDGAATTVTLDHEHLVAILGVDVVILHIEDCWNWISETSKRERRKIPVSAPNDPMAHPPDQLQKMFSTIM